MKINKMKNKKQDESELNRGSSCSFLRSIWLTVQGEFYIIYKWHSVEKRKVISYYGVKV